MAQNKQDLKHSEEEYFHKADNLIHNSCLTLRSLFRRRWEQTSGTPWTEASAQEFINGIGKDFFKRALPIQKEWLKGGKMDEWDMTLLCHLIKQIKWRVEDEKSKFQLKKENQAVEKLNKERNKTAHNSRKKLNEEGYHKVEEVVFLQLTELGVSQAEIASIIQKAGVLTSVDGWAIAKKMLHKGNKKFKVGNFARATELYSNALLVPNLLPSKQAILLEKRAIARVASVDVMEQGTEKTTRLQEAMQDVKKSIEFGNDSWNAHLVIAKICKQQNEQQLAIEHLGKALKLSPGQDEVKAELKNYKLLWGTSDQSTSMTMDGAKVMKAANKNEVGKQSDSSKKEKVVMKSLSNPKGSSDSNPRWTGNAKDMDMDDLKQRAYGGSITAQRLLKALYRQIEFEGLWGSGPPFTEDQSRQLVDDLHFCITNANYDVKMESTLLAQIAKYTEALLKTHGHIRSELDRKLRLCFVWRRNDLPKNIEVLKVGLERYPDDVYYYTFLSFMYTYANDPKSALETANLGLRIFADHVELLLDKAYLTEFILVNGGICMEVRESASGVTMLAPDIRVLYLRFLEQAPKDHYNVPQAYYAIAASYISTGRLEVILAYYHRGLESEKHQLPCYIPYDCRSKPVVERAIEAMQPGSSKSSGEPAVNTKAEVSSQNPLMYSKLLPDNVWRVEMIKFHREKLRNSWFQNKLKSEFFKTVSSSPEELRPQQKLPLPNLKPFVMKDVDETKDYHEYLGCFITLTLIEDPVVGAPLKPIHSIARDENGYVTRIYFHNFTQNLKPEKQLGFGRRLTVIDPHVRLNFNDRRPYIQVDDSGSIISHDEVVNMCRCCGEENAPNNCARCKWAKYCSRECQKKDWKIFGHGIICMPK